MRSLEATILTEDQLRAFQMCPRYLRYGGTTVFPDTIRLLKLTTEKAISDSIRNDKLDPSMKYMKALLRSSKELELKERYMEGQLRDMHSKVGIALGELFDGFSANTFLPIFGPAPWRVQVSRSTIQLQVSGVLYGQNSKTLHIIDFSPYQTMHGLRNDPISALKAKTLMQFARPWFSGKKDAVLHTFSINEKDKLLYNRLDSKSVGTSALETIERTVQGIESGLDFPVLPCTKQCPYKSKCIPETT